MSITMNILHQVGRSHLKKSSRITGSAAWLPEKTLTIAEIGKRIKANSISGLPTSLIGRTTGVEKVHVMDENMQASDLAVNAARKLFEQEAVHKAMEEGIDLLIFASASQDMIEPATSHIVANKLRLHCPVMDVKNACNSLLNGIEVADSLIKSGKYHRVLVVSGECPSRGVRWKIEDRETYKHSFPGFTMSDAGAAVLVENAGLPFHGRDLGLAPAEIIDSEFHAYSQHWDVGMLPTGGSYYPRGFDRTYFEIDGGRLFEAFLSVEPTHLTNVLERNNLTWDDFAMVAVHQVALPYLSVVCEFLGVNPEKVVPTIADHGNIASCTLPLQLQIGKEEGRIRPGDLVALVGLAGGISVGTMIVRV